ncbi:MAG: PAS domain-containing protein [Acidobacteriota bacterium]
MDREPKIRSDEDIRSNNEYRDLIDSTGIGVLFLDRSLRINRFSRPVCDVFSLAESDIGRPLADIQSRLEYSDLRADADQVLETSQMVERDVRSTNGTAYLMQMTPYRTADERVAGVVIAFVDITSRVRAEAELRAAYSEVSEMVENMSNSSFAVDRNGNFTYANRRAEQFLGISRGEVLGKNIWRVLADTGESEFVEKLRRASGVQAEQTFEAFSPKLNLWMEVRVHPASSGASVYIRDITERKRREENLAFLAEINRDLAAE